MKFEKAFVEIVDVKSCDVITTSGDATNCCPGLACDDMGF